MKAQEAKSHLMREEMILSGIAHFERDSGQSGILEHAASPFPGEEEF